MNLIIVESPTKAKKIQSYLGKKYAVKSSQGHIVELDTKRLDSMITNNFTPLYKLQSSKRKVIQNLQSGTYKHVILAADDDREGDAIAWHCGNLLKVDFQTKNRIVFNEITKKAIETALKHPQTIDLHSVNAQRCRQLLDLIIGFKLSPLLWKHIDSQVRGLSAGRVQSCLLKMLIDHEKKIENYIPEQSYKITGNFTIDDILLECIYQNKDMDYSEQSVLNFFKQLQLNKEFFIDHVKKSKEKKYPPSPLITSSLQQMAQKDFGFSVSQTMSIAQKLFENGKITYMRTDSTFICDDFKQTIQTYVESNHGSNYYKEYVSKKIKGAQEAHEAIRPTDIHCQLSDKFTECDKKLYNLIMKTTITSHMKPAEYDVYTYQLQNKQIQGKFVGSHKFLQFPGFLDYSNKQTIEKPVVFSKQSTCRLQQAKGKPTQTNPPQYWNESSIVKQLESSGVGRPSTYASIINTLYTRNYTEVTTIPETKQSIQAIQLKNDIVEIVEDYLKIPKQTKRIKVTELGYTVMRYLLEHFSSIIHVEFTSRVESDLDEISLGKMNWTSMIKKLYDSFIPTVIQQMKFKRVKQTVQSIDGFVLKRGKYGEYLHDSNTKENLTIDEESDSLNITDLSGNIEESDSLNITDLSGNIVESDPLNITDLSGNIVESDPLNITDLSGNLV